MRLRERDVEMTPEVERELAALDDALGGRPVAPDLAAVAELARDLRNERPGLPAGAAERLDRAAAEGFGRDRGPLARLRSRIGALAPRRWVPALGAAATFAVVAVVAISQSGVLGGSGGGSPAPTAVSTGRPEPSVAGKAGGPGAAQVTPPERGAFDRARSRGGAIAPAPPIPAPGGGIAPGHRRRVVERAAALTLSTSPNDVRDVADGVVEVTRRHRGFVLSSSVSSADTGVASGAQFDLRIPSSRLRPALRDLTSLAHVEALSENGRDITGPAVTARERFRDSRRGVRALLRALGQATDPGRIGAIRARLAVARRELAAARHDLAGIASRARLASVHVAIDGNGTSASGSWTPGDALHDALRVLAVAAGVGLIALAALVPAAIVAALLWLAAGAIARRRRERALDA